MNVALDGGGRLAGTLPRSVGLSRCLAWPIRHAFHLAESAILQIPGRSLERNTPSTPTGRHKCRRRRTRWGGRKAGEMRLLGRPQRLFLRRSSVAELLDVHVGGELGVS